jgi:hypothetical protein
MARKAEPNDIIEDFRADLEKVRLNLRELIGLIKQDRLLKEIAIDTFLRAAVSFETFRSDWHIAAINRDAAVFAKTLTKSIKGTVAGGRDYRGASDFVEPAIGKNPSVAVIRTIVDPLGRNVSFGKTDEWVKRAKRELAPRYVARVRALTDQDMAIITAVIATRNCISHRSSGSVREMNAALQRLPAGLRRPVNDVSVKGIGAYPWASPPGQNAARATRFLTELRRIASVLQVT